jgi:hypothetical protein
LLQSFNLTFATLVWLALAAEPANTAALAVTITSLDEVLLITPLNVPLLFPFAISRTFINILYFSVRRDLLSLFGAQLHVLVIVITHFCGAGIGFTLIEVVFVDLILLVLGIIVDTQVNTFASLCADAAARQVAILFSLVFAKRNILFPTLTACNTIFGHNSGLDIFARQ